MYQHHTTSALLAQAHQRELYRLAGESRRARQTASGDVTPSSQLGHQVTALLVALLVVLGALALF
ncbi:MAG TPA: hypothetical protein VM305_02920 [Candidatus Limnocylindrales bacterium]|nr:hypothetical protein [Candidatus Limnocylindrales bacterium]